MNTLLIFLLLYALDIAAIVVLLRFGLKGCGISVVVNMLLVSRFGGIHVQVLGVSTHFGLVFFAAAIFALSLAAARLGFWAVQRIVFAVLASLIFSAVVNQVVLAAGYIPAPLTPYFYSGAQLVTGSLLALYFAASLNTYLILKRPGWRGKIAANCASHALASVIGFHVVYAGNWSERQILAGILFALLLKISLCVLDTPVYCWLLSKECEVKAT